jgi:hypothetical protein
VLTAKDAVIAEQRETIMAKDATITAKNSTITAKDATITERNTVLAEKDATIVGQWRKISELDYRIDDLTAGNAGQVADKAAPDAGKERREVAAPDGADHSRMPEKPQSGEDEAALAGAEDRTSVQPSQENEKSTVMRRWLRFVPSNETAVLLAGAFGLGAAIANSSQYLSDGWSATAGAVITFALGGVAWVNKYWKKGSDGNQSQD